jgi:hypothetical protein
MESSASSSATEILTVRVDESMVKKGKGSLNFPLSSDSSYPETTDIPVLTRLMYVQWIVMTTLVVYLAIRLSYSSDEQWIAYMVALVVLLLLFVPILLIRSCSCCCHCQDSGGEGQLMVRRYCTAEILLKNVGGRKPSESSAY